MKPTAPIPPSVLAAEQELVAWLRTAEGDALLKIVRLLRWAVLLIETFEARGWTLDEFIDHMDRTLEWRGPNRSQIA